MKTFLVSALIAIAAQAITLQDAALATTEHKEIKAHEQHRAPGQAMEDQAAERTIVGFLFSGFDFGMLWEDLTDDQREAVKSDVFQKTLAFNNLKDTDYKNMEFKFTDEQRKIEEDKQATRQA